MQLLFMALMESLKTVFLLLATIYSNKILDEKDADIKFQRKAGDDNDLRNVIVQSKPPKSIMDLCLESGVMYDDISR
jgi:hypothetical protein